MPKPSNSRGFRPVLFSICLSLPLLLSSQSATAMSGLETLSCMAKLCLEGGGGSPCDPAERLLKHYERIGKKSWFLRQCPDEKGSKNDATANKRWAETAQWYEEQGLTTVNQGQISVDPSAQQYWQNYTGAASADADALIAQFPTAESVDQFAASEATLGTGQTGAVSYPGGGKSESPTGDSALAAGADAIQSAGQKAGQRALDFVAQATKESAGGSNTGGTPSGGGGGSSVIPKNLPCQVYLRGEGLQKLRVLEGSQEQVVAAGRSFVEILQARLCARYPGERLTVDVYSPRCRLAPDAVTLSLALRLVAADGQPAKSWRQSFQVPVNSKYPTADRCRIASAEAARILN